MKDGNVIPAAVYLGPIADNRASEAKRERVEEPCELCADQLQSGDRFPGDVEPRYTRCLECGLWLCKRHARDHFTGRDESVRLRCGLAELNALRLVAAKAKAMFETNLSPIHQPPDAELWLALHLALAGLPQSGDRGAAEPPLAAIGIAGPEMECETCGNNGWIDDGRQGMDCPQCGDYSKAHAP